MLLDQSHLLRQHIQPQVAPAQHDGVCLLSNGLEVEQALAGLTLGYQLQQHTACIPGLGGMTGISVLGSALSPGSDSRFLDVTFSCQILTLSSKLPLLSMTAACSFSYHVQVQQGPAGDIAVGMP